MLSFPICFKTPQKYFLFVSALMYQPFGDFRQLCMTHSRPTVHYTKTLCPFRSMSFFVGETQEEEERKKLYIVSTRCLMSTDGVCLHE